jgi:hypothetical protein
VKVQELLARTVEAVTATEHPSERTSA